MILDSKLDNDVGIEEYDTHAKRLRILPNSSVLLIERHGIGKDKLDVSSKFARSVIFLAFDMFLTLV
jgi:hypothetical protein